MPSNPEKACVNCHFLVKAYVNSDHTETLAEEQRGLLRNRKYVDNPFREDAFLKCYQGVWSERNGIEDDQEARQKRLVKRDRSKSCFFWEYTPGMEQEAAGRLQKRKEDRDKFWERNKLIRLGAWAAIAAVILDFLVQFGKWAIQFIQFVLSKVSH